jgi:S-methylmethionine-dependent homocysteine/selenocysteine methylase
MIKNTLAKEFDSKYKKKSEEIEKSHRKQVELLEKNI